MSNSLHPKDQFGAIINDNDIWLPQKAISKILASRVKNVNEIIRDLEISGFCTTTREFLIVQKEGRRDIKRRIKHYDFETIHAIALRSNRLDKLTDFMEYARSEGILKSRYFVPMRKELKFGEMLSALLQDITLVQRQFPVAGFLVDFYLPEMNIVVEFDEGHHEKINHSLKDRKLQRAIETMLDATFIRVTHGAEWDGLNRIIKALLSANPKEP
ncbi:hypothetical protein CCAX7_14050 [Capsulimonas corticalis]|uniref:Uncharacterized protein n=1 Tax=Capsulimonas corticalis TaxID=2219043 RepID=A0A402D707_9BACT|nr:DUF559 domain-containing protein [Capsulimonas corticalis]BDI29354.1 hypothetical protein CCAX7_14050 [Capsulimonas corticalis]